MKAAIPLCDLDVVDAGLAPPHQALLVELPLLVAIGAMPPAARVVPFVLEAHRDAIAVERPEILDQAIVELGRPFALEEGYDRGPTLEKFRSVAPAAVLGIGERDAFGVARIPGIFRHASLLGGGLPGKGRQWWTRHDDLVLLAVRLYRPLLMCRWRCLSVDRHYGSAFIRIRSAFGIGCARPSLIKATRTSALTRISPPRRTSCASMIEAPFTASGQVTTSSTSSIRRFKEIQRHRTHDEGKPGRFGFGFRK